MSASSSALAAGALPVTRDAFDHAAGARVEVVVEPDPRAAWAGDEAGEVAGDERLTSAAAAGTGRTDAGRGEGAVGDIGRSAHRVSRVGEADRESRERELGGREIDV